MGIVFGAIDTGFLGVAALIGASFAGILGAIVSKWGRDYFLSPRAFLSIIGESLVLDYDFAVARSISLSKRKNPILSIWKNGFSCR